ncbi:conjugal transfer protein TraU [Klebsiella aerogenes]|nr:conjugal transfer protein TraU [Klebsiella aerogenes]
MDIAYLSEIDPTWVDSSLTTILNPEAILFANPIAQGACAADALASAFPYAAGCAFLVWLAATAHFTRLTARSVMSPARCSRRYWSVSVWPSSSTGRDKLWRVSGRTRRSVTNIPPRIHPERALALSDGEHVPGQRPVPSAWTQRDALGGRQKSTQHPQELRLSDVA